MKQRTVVLQHYYTNSPNDKKMAKYLLAIDGSDNSDRAFDLLTTKMMHPDKDEVTIVSIINKKKMDNTKRQHTDDLLKRYDGRAKQGGVRLRARKLVKVLLIYDNSR